MDQAVEEPFFGGGDRRGSFSGVIDPLVGRAGDL